MAFKKILSAAGIGLSIFLMFSNLSLAEDSPAAPAPAGQAVSAPEGQTDSDGKTEQTQSPSYVLQPGDRIFIKIYPEDPYIKGGEMQISSDGNITLPLAGKIAVGSKSVLDSEKEIAAVLAEDYLVNPEVVIEVKEMAYKGVKASIILLGQVRKPGTYELPPTTGKMTLLEAISLSGGFSDIANIKKIKIVRVEKGKKRVIKANAEKIIGGKDSDVDLKAGDVVTVAESLF